MPEKNVMYVNLADDTNKYLRSQASTSLLTLTAVLDALLREAMVRGWVVSRGGAAVTEAPRKDAG
jgi:hypothetical protein